MVNRRLRFAEEVRRLRVDAGLTQARLAERANLSQSQVGGIEVGSKWTTRRTAERIDAALNARGVLLARFIEGDKETTTGFTTWFAGLVKVESDAAEIFEWNPLVSPGLLQCREYAYSLIRAGRPDDTETEVEERVQARLNRAKILDSDRPPRFTAIIDETVLRRGLGGPETHAKQLEHFLSMSDHPRVSLTVVEASDDAHPGLDGAFLLLTDRDGSTIAFREDRAAGHPADDAETVRTYRRLAQELATRALSPSASRRLIAAVLEECRS